jgi:hypothetical protein
MNRKKLKALYALAMLMCLGSSLLVFVMAADEQSIVSGGQSHANSISVESLIAHPNEPVRAPCRRSRQNRRPMPTSNFRGFVTEVGDK